MPDILEVATQAARKAGASIMAAADNIAGLNIEEKSLNDFVSEVDKQSESIIAEIVQQAFPDHSFLGEEFGCSGDQASAYQWIVDPLDGTTNYLREIPHYAVSIAISLNAVVEHAVVFDPAKDELFTASRGQGAYLNGKQIKVSHRTGFKGALLATGVPYSGAILAEISAFTSTMEGLLAQETSGIRRLGAAALDLAYVAAGRYDGFWEASLKPWDIAAGALLVEEAGGIVCDFLGSNAYLTSGDIVAASKEVYNQIVAETSIHYQR